MKPQTAASMNWQSSLQSGLKNPGAAVAARTASQIFVSGFSNCDFGAGYDLKRIGLEFPVAQALGKAVMKLFVLWLTVSI